MAGLKEIKRRLRSVKNTQKITYAMKLVSAAKLKRAQDAVTNSRAYTDGLNQLLLKLSVVRTPGSAAHPLMEERGQIKRIGILVIGGQRGLCGGFNSNLHKKVESLLRDLSQKYPGVPVDAFILGRKPAEYSRRKNRQYVQAYEDLPENANVWPIDEVVLEIERRFREGLLDEVQLVFTRFRSAISQIPTAERLLPLDASSVTGQLAAVQNSAADAPILFEPSADALYSALMPRILRSKVRQACLDSKASETASRMTAMDSATKNAKQLSRKLELQHNKLRQLRITSELLDIIGGAEAIE